MVVLRVVATCLVPVVLAAALAAQTPLPPVHAKVSQWSFVQEHRQIASPDPGVTGYRVESVDEARNLPKDVSCVHTDTKDLKVLSALLAYPAIDTLSLTNRNGSELFTIEGFALVAKFQRLRRLSIVEGDTAGDEHADGYSITDRLPGELITDTGAFDSLEEFSVSGAFLSASFLRALGKLDGLRALSLGGLSRELKPADVAAAFAGTGNLERLSIVRGGRPSEDWHPRLSVAAATAIAGLPRLKSLSLWARLDKGTLPALARSKSITRLTVRHMHFEFDDVESEYGEVNEELGALGNLTQLQSLIVHGGGHYPVDQLCLGLRKLRQLKEVSINVGEKSVRGQLTQTGLDALGSIDSINLLRFHECHTLGNLEFTRIAKLTQLKILSLHDCDIEDSTLDDLSASDSLEALSLHNAAGVTDSGLMYLAGIDTLRRLELVFDAGEPGSEDIRLGDEGLTSFLKHATKIEYLYLRGLHTLTSKSYGEIARHPALREVCCHRSNNSRENVARLASSKTIEVFLVFLPSDLVRVIKEWDGLKRLKVVTRHSHEWLGDPDEQLKELDSVLEVQLVEL